MPGGNAKLGLLQSNLYSVDDELRLSRARGVEADPGTDGDRRHRLGDDAAARRQHGFTYPVVNDPASC